MARRIIFASFWIFSICTTSFAQLQINRVFSNLAFNKPIFLTHAGDGTDRIFVVEQRGMIHVFPNRENVSSAKIFLDIRNKINDRFSESGLLGLAFHPDYASNGKFYVSYNFGNLSSRIAEYTVSSNPDVADAASERPLLELSQPRSNHNGGQVAFGPDGMLYVAFGDGGGRDDQFQNGQNRTTLYGNILRIDVNRTSGNLAYMIPSDNPFFGNASGWREEIWAWGLRNPWRFSFDRQTGAMWAADVGQGDWEEVDLIQKGNNYGWNVMEGFHCFLTSNCNTTGLTLPIVEYNHSQGQSVTGGYVYHGKMAPQLQGIYIYGDFVSRRIWGLKYENGQVVSNDLLGTSPGAISSFGADENGEVYVLGHNNGRIYRFEDPTTAVAENNSREHTLSSEFTFSHVFPNPFNPATTIRYKIAKSTYVELSVFDALGQQVKTLISALQPSGSYAMRWNATDSRGRNVSSGIYFIKLAVDGFRQSQKVLLVR
ncbi:MAG: PQQ-dependent sugar dehydrogenase [bacterium]